MSQPAFDDDAHEKNERMLRRLIHEVVCEANRSLSRRADYEQGRITPGQKFYHASPKRFRHGDILTGGHSGGYGVAHDNVCMTTSPDPHGTIRYSIPDWTESSKSGGSTRDWYVYEVEPLYGVRYVEGNSEYQTRAARVVANLGKASAILKKRQPVAGVSMALSPVRDRDRTQKYAQRRQRRQERLDGDE
jgi:hypothetical protein